MNFGGFASRPRRRVFPNSAYAVCEVIFEKVIKFKDCVKSTFNSLFGIPDSPPSSYVPTPVQSRAPTPGPSASPIRFETLSSISSGSPNPSPSLNKFERIKRLSKKIVSPKHSNNRAKTLQSALSAFSSIIEDNLRSPYYFIVQVIHLNKHDFVVVDCCTPNHQAIIARSNSSGHSAYMVEEQPRHQDFR
ncbi:Hypothetical protein CINCED_3A005813 [Cinara cedri]|uniref:Uncharacterized protein n=1 Tax=Cinara cedri TaxID=506608 RepID=A0A5E4NLZ2_9HEMI|nr:Hypothetical protein CINCED_3A005813 [Cinara cedri]